MCLSRSEKLTFLLYERTPTEMVGLSQGGSQRGACNRGARGAPSQPTATTINRHAPSMLSNTQLPGMVLPTADREMYHPCWGSTTLPLAVYSNNCQQAHPEPTK